MGGEMSKPQSIEDMIKKAENEMSVSSLARKMVGKFGGMDKLVDEVFAEYQTMEPGTQVRARMLTSIIDLVKECDNGPTDPLAGMDKEDLEAVIRTMKLD
jgi:hypothetical protein